MDKGNFWDYVAMYNFQQGNDTGGWIGAGFNLIGTKISDKLGGSSCSYSDDNLHHGEIVRQIGAGRGGLATFECKCDYCGGTFTVTKTKDDLSAAYDEYVETLPATGYTSTGGLTWQPTLNDFDFDKSGLRFQIISSDSSFKNFSVFPYEGSRSFTNASWKFDFVSSSNAISAFFSEWNYARVLLSGFVKVPFSGNYRIISSPFYGASGLFKNGAAYKDSGLYSVGSFSHISSGELISFSSEYSGSPSTEFSSLLYTIYFPVFEVIPDTALSADTYNITTRPTSITGGNYGIIGDNGQITKVEDNSTIINETNNTYYNPATGQTVPITNWSYDYSDRSYKVTLESGDTATITYGDENITIQEGDTVYNVYYLIDGSGSGEVCAHEWAETSTTPATCTMSGSKLLTCSKCQQTKTESLSALGHDWQVKQSVTTEYDDTGQLVQEGYIIYECSRCHEQYKAASGTSPPVNPSDPDASGDGVFSGIFGLLLDFLGFFFKTFKDFTKSGVKAFLGALQDGTSDIFGLLNPFDWSA